MFKSTYMYNILYLILIFLVNIICLKQNHTPKIDDNEIESPKSSFNNPPLPLTNQVNYNDNIILITQGDIFDEHADAITVLKHY